MCLALKSVQTIKPHRYLQLLSAIPKDDPLLQTLMEEKQILSRSKRTPSSSGKQDEIREISSEHLRKCDLDRSSASENQRNVSLTSDCESDLPERDAGAVCLPVNIQPVEEREIIQNRLSLEQIRQLPKFANYHPGEPSKVGDVLYMLNINC